jgi:hypothetical protein
MKTDKIEFAYVILDEYHDIVNELNEPSQPCYYVDEKAALDDIRGIFKKYPEELGPFYVGKVTLISKVYPPTELKIEKL